MLLLKTSLSNMKLSMATQSNFEIYLKEIGMKEHITDVVVAICKGKDNKEVAAELNLTVPQTKHCLAYAYKKLGIRDKSQLLVFSHNININGWDKEMSFVEYIQWCARSLVSKTLSEEVLALNNEDVVSRRVKKINKGGGE